MIHRLLFVTIILLATQEARPAGYSFDYNTRCQLAYQHYMALRISEGDALIRREFMADPHNLMATYLADYGDFMLLLFNGNPNELSQRQAHQEERLSLLDRADDAQPWKRLCKAGIYLHWSLVHLRCGANFKAAGTFRKSYLLLKENAAAFPGFAPNNIFLGAEEAMTGAIPDDYKWLASILGMKGNIRTGLDRLSAFLEAHPSATEPLRNEAVIYYQYLRFYLLSEQEPVWKFVNSLDFPVKDNLLHVFIRANIDLNYRKAGDALQTLLLTQTVPGWLQFPVFDYEMGNAMIMRLDDHCLPYFERYISKNTGQLFTKDALQKIAFIWYLRGNKARAEEKRKLILKSGSTNTDADKQAQRFALDPNWPDPVLLEARLLTDGGYSALALARLRQLNMSHFTDPAGRVEFAFRLGRAYDESGETGKAVQSYQQAINLGRKRPEYFAARSALQMAFIYEKSGQVKEALRYFHECLDMPRHDFQASIEQQAKAGINRLE